MPQAKYWTIVLVLTYLGATRASLCEPTQSTCHDYGISNYNYVRPFSPDAYWNIPACNLGKWIHSDEYANRWFQVQGKLGAGFGASTFGAFNQDSSDFSMPVYYSSNATEKRRVITTMYSPNFEITELVPWNPTWTPAGGSDHHIIILDIEKGMEWDIWLVHIEFPGIPCLGPGIPYGGFNEKTDICAGSARLLKYKNGSVADYRTFSGSNGGSRGVGIQNYAMLLTAQEVAAGEVRHALSAGAFNTMFGPWCTDEEMQDPTVFGFTCGYAMRPAGKVEWGSYESHIFSTYPPSPYKNGTGDYYRNLTVPEGIRFVLNVDDQYIEDWLDKRQYTGARRNTARIITRALRDYGWIISDTGGTSSLGTDGNQNPESRALWEAAGVTPRDTLLKDLITSPDQLYVAAPPLDEAGKWYTLKASPVEVFTIPTCTASPGSTSSSSPSPSDQSGSTSGNNSPGPSGQHSSTSGINSPSQSGLTSSNNNNSPSSSGTMVLVNIWFIVFVLLTMF